MALKAFWEIHKGATEYAVFEDIGQQNGMSGSTIRRIYLSHLEQWKRRLDELMAAGLIEFEGVDDQGNPQASMTSCGTADELNEAAVILPIADRSPLQ